MKVLGAKTAEVVTDNGYYSEDNMASFLREGMAFITLVKTGLKWVKDEIDAHNKEFGRSSTYCTSEQDMSGSTVKVTRSFRYICKRSDKRTGVLKGQEVFFEKKIYLHIYCNEAKKMAMDREFRREIVELRDQINNGLDPEDLNKSGQAKVKKCLVIVRKKNGMISAELNDDGMDEYNRYHGFIALAASREKDTGRCLQKNRMREHIEDSIEIKKEKCDGDKPRNWYDNTHNGKLFVQFVAMGYYDYLYGGIKRVRDEVCCRLQNPEGINSKEISIWRRLKTWLHDMSLERILAWFDVYETSVVSSKMARKVWTTENTHRDRLFLKLLGVIKE